MTSYNNNHITCMMCVLIWWFLLPWDGSPGRQFAEINVNKARQKEDSEDLHMHVLKRDVGFLHIDPQKHYLTLSLLGTKESCVLLSKFHLDLIIKQFMAYGISGRLET